MFIDLLNLLEGTPFKISQKPCARNQHIFNGLPHGLKPRKKKSEIKFEKETTT